MSVVQRLLAGVDFRVSGRRVSNRHVIDCNAELLDAGVATRAAYEAAVSAAPAWILPLTRAAHAEGNLWPLLKVVDTELSYYGYAERRDERSLRANLVAGCTDEIERMLRGQSAARGFWRFLAEPWADDLFAVLPASARDGAVRDCLGHVIETAAPPEGVVRAALRRPG